MRQHLADSQHREKLQVLQRDANRMAKVSNRVARLFSKPLVDELAAVDELGDVQAKNSIRADLYCSLVAGMVDEDNGDLSLKLQQDDLEFDEVMEPVFKDQDGGAP
jgi:hypothetical protein